jgi:type II secretory pathway pseudopilin PulG
MDVAGLGAGLIAALFVVGLIGIAVVVAVWYLLSRSDRRR